MSFRLSIPEVVLEENTYASKFVDVLDNIQEYKTENIATSLRTLNVAVSVNKKWFLKYFSEYGLKDVPYDLPVEIMTQVLLNIDSLFRMRGSIAGLYFLCNIFTFGEVTIDAEGFYAKPGVLLLDDLAQGYITGDNVNQFFCLVEDNSLLNAAMTLEVSIKSKYFSDEYPTDTQQVIKNYIKKKVPEFLGFSPNKQITYTFDSYDRFVFHPYMNKYFHP